MNKPAHTAQLRRWPDRIGAIVSVACGIHCAAMSLLFFLYPTILVNRATWQAGVIEQVKHLEDGLFILAWIFALIAMTMAWINRRTLGPPLLAALGLALLTIALKSELHEYALAGSLVALTGGILIASAHFWNLNNSRPCPVRSPSQI